MGTQSTNLGGVLESEIGRSYNSFSGADIKAVIGPFQFAELQAVSYNITREKAPVYCMGSPDPLSYSRNKRGIAGSLIWVNFDRHALLNIVYQCGGQFLADIDEIRPQYQGSVLNSASAIFSSQVVRGDGSTAGSTVSTIDTTQITSVGSTKQLASPWYSDQVLPFDITLACANEYGAMAATKIFGVEILNEGWGTSIDDAVNEMQATFVARTIEPMAVVNSPYIGDGTTA
jgi:hypothetical protein